MLILTLLFIFLKNGNADPGEPDFDYIAVQKNGPPVETGALLTIACHMKNFKVREPLS